MGNRILWLLFLTGATAMTVLCQDSIRANVRGNNNGDQGKCTIEADVDSVAEIEVRGDTARIRTLSGDRSTLRRFDCDGTMPSRPSNFRFTGVDGRGRQQLVQDPRNGGVAVIRIEDPKGGREGYTFDIEWQGQGGYNSGDRNQGGSWGGGRGDGDRRRYGNNSQGTFTVTCSSENGRRQYCEADVRGAVRLVRQFSRNACRQNDTWGYDSRGIWVDRGCGADFSVGR